MSGIMSSKLRSITHRLTERNCLPHGFNGENKVSGKKRYYPFMKRRSELSLRWPLSISLAKARVTLKVSSNFLPFQKNWQDRENQVPLYSQVWTRRNFLQYKERARILHTEKGKHHVHHNSVIGNGRMLCEYSGPLRITNGDIMVIFRLQRKDEDKDGGPPGINFAFEGIYITNKIPFV